MLSALVSQTLRMLTSKERDEDLHSLKGAHRGRQGHRRSSTGPTAERRFPRPAGIWQEAILAVRSSYIVRHHRAEETAKTLGTGVSSPRAGGDMTAGRASERSDERKREVTGTVRFNPCDGVDADSRAVAGYSRDQRPTSRVREAGFGPQTCPVTCAFGFVVPTGFEPVPPP